MSDEIDREQTPLRWRLNGAHDDAPPMHADSPAALETIETVETLETGETIATEQRLAALATPVALPVVTPLAPLATPLATKQQLARLVERTDERVARWMADQERGLRPGLDALTDLERRKADEVARFDTWIASERARVERELSEEEGRFRQRLMGELVVFEEQLGLRLREQEERLARWWEEADRIAKERFAALGPAPLRTPR